MATVTYDTQLALSEMGHRRVPRYLAPQAAGFEFLIVCCTARVCFWPKADIPSCTAHVCF